MDRAPEDIRRAEEEAEHRQLEAESLVEAARDREVMAYYDVDPYEAWGDYELCVWERTAGVEADLEHFEAVMIEGDESLGRDNRAEESGIGVDIPEYLDWGYMGL